ncbi:MAG: enoyl-CoA hydratase/isomerase family protein [Abyssibacter sp.]|nr:3-hydroxyacyl-CoA dehydrogenase NAD-binding domain-containing protein [Abyssibacter sp.]MCK5857767.1 enoyl-CoA hydratase/isomerase family protein [Abyssibacter sp.]
MVANLNDNPESPIRYEVDADGIAVITLDMPGRSQNVLNETLTEPFQAVVEQAYGDDTVKGLVITSGKRDFLAGADIDGLYQMTDPAEVVAMSDGFKALLRQLETGGKPVVCALNGSALGGGLEMALACHHRIALNNPKAKFGLVEVKLGLLPGGGGTQRLPRLIGIQTALPLLMEGKELRVDAAKAQGLIDEVADTPDELITKAKAWAKVNPKAAQPWDEKKFKYPGGDAKHPAVAQMLAIAPSMLRAKTHGNFPATLHIMASVVEGSLVDFENALKIESRYFAACVVSPEAKNMITTLWYQLNHINKGGSRPDGYDRARFSKVGILGAGMMGSAIAFVSAKAGFDVVLKDVSQDGADKGKAYSESLVKKAVSKGRMSKEDGATLLDKILPTGDVQDLTGCDLIVEAVFEDRGLKAKVTQETEAVMDASGVFASNTSTLPITGLAEPSARPDQFVGLHFFSPADKMPLVEIIKGEQTSPETLARAFDYVQQIKKTPIVVNDSRGFYTSRVFSTYIMEGIALLTDGQHPRRIEVAGLKSGMPVGPLALHDEVSLSLSLHIMDQTRKDLEAAGKPVPEQPGYALIRKMVSELDRPGKKAGRGFYDYPDGGKKQLWSGLAEHWPVAAEQIPESEIIERMLLTQANETVRCLEEGVLESVWDANIGAIFGWGFAPFQGGPLQYLNAYGLDKAVVRLREFAERYGERFTPAERLVAMADAGQSFERVPG